MKAHTALRNHHAGLLCDKIRPTPTRKTRPRGEAARERRQREATAALAQLFQPKK